MNKPAIRELDSSRKQITLRVDADVITTIKILANLKGDSASNMINDVLRAFVDRNKIILDDFKKAAIKTYDNIQW